MYAGDNQITALYVGDTALTALYSGDVKIFPVTQSSAVILLNQYAAFTRSSGAYHTQPDGTLVAVQADEERRVGALRVDHADGVDYGFGVLGVEYQAPGSGSFPLLVEPASENRTYSPESPDQNPAIGASITPNVATLGDIGIHKFEKTDSTTYLRFMSAIFLSCSYTRLSAIVKSGTTDRVTLYSSTSLKDQTAVGFNLTTESIEASVDLQSLIIEATINPVGDGFYYCSMLISHNTAYTGLFPHDGTESSLTDANGGSIGDSFLFHSMKLETGNTIIHSTTYTVQPRTTDNLSYDFSSHPNISNMTNISFISVDDLDVETTEYVFITYPTVSNSKVSWDDANKILTFLPETFGPMKIKPNPVIIV